jgi:hypothetical protein
MGLQILLLSNFTEILCICTASRRTKLRKCSSELSSIHPKRIWEMPEKVIKQRLPNRGTEKEKFNYPSACVGLFFFRGIINTSKNVFLTRQPRQSLIITRPLYYMSKQQRRILISQDPRRHSKRRGNKKSRLREFVLSSCRFHPCERG